MTDTRFANVYLNDGWFCQVHPTSTVEDVEQVMYSYFTEDGIDISGDFAVLEVEQVGPDFYAYWE